MTRRSTGILIGLIALLLLSVSIGRAVIARRQAQAELSAPAAPTVVHLAPSDLTVARTVSLDRVLSVSGSLAAVNTAVVKAKIAAEVRSLSVREGDAVKVGQVLGQLDPTDAQARLRQAQEQAQSAKAQLDIAERTLQNNRALVDQGFISRNALDTSTSNAAAARANLLAAHAATDVARKAVADAVIRAPIGGAISQRLVQPGEKVGVDTRLLEIVDLSRVELEAALAPEDVVALRPGHEAQVRVDGIPAPLKGTIARINPAAEAGTRAVMVYLTLEPHPAVRHGLFASGDIRLPPAQGLAVPESSVQSSGTVRQVLVVEDGRVVRRDVTLGERGRLGDTAMVIVRQGLAEGAMVLTAAATGVAAGTQVATAAPATAASAASR